MNQQRMPELDVFRGLVMAFMIVVENPGNWNIFKALRHARWGDVGANGLPVHESITPTDLVMPFFLFIVGVVLVPALRKAQNSDLNQATLVKRILKRSAILFTLGVIVQSYGSWLSFLIHESPARIELAGALQRIAIVFGASALLFLRYSAKQITGIGVFLLIAYALVLRIPVPAYPDPLLIRQYHTPDQIPACFPEWVDAQVLGFSNPEGIMSTFPAIVTGLIGVLVGILLTSSRPQKLKKQALFVGGVTLLTAGYLWSLFLPCIKDLWTSSYVLVTAGYALVSLLGVKLLLEFKVFKALSPPAIAYGVNCLAVYIASHLLATTLRVCQIQDGAARTSIHQYLNQHLFEPWLSPQMASLAFSIFMLVFWAIPLWYLARKKIYIKV